VTRGHRLQAIVDAGLAPSVRWLKDQIRAGKIPAHKAGRSWILTDDDLDEALKVWASPRYTGQSEPAATSPLSLTSTSLRQRAAS
jgi:hypothetical protein